MSAFKRVDQEPSGCWVACLASITGIPLSEFPKPPPGDGSDGWSSEQGCVYHNGTMAVLHRHGWTLTDLGTRVPIEGYAVASGPSPRHPDGKVWHAVVWRDGEFLFDPNPSREMLGGAQPEWFELVVRVRPFEPETTAWFEWKGNRYQAVRSGEKWILACPVCGDGIVFSHNDSPHDEMWLPHTVERGADGALTISPSVVCPRKCGWHVMIVGGAA